MSAKTKILIFQGGGYDGCFWEWNAIVFEAGNVIKSLVSGRTGKSVAESVAGGAFATIREKMPINSRDVWELELY